MGIVLEKYLRIGQDSHEFMKSFVTCTSALGLLLGAHAAVPTAKPTDTLFQALQIATTVKPAEQQFAADYSIGTSCIAASLPVLMQGQGKDLQLQNFKVRVLLRQHSAYVIVEGEIYNHSDSKKKVSMGVPFVDLGLRGSSDNAQAGPLKNPLAQRLSGYNLIVGGLVTKSSWLNQAHPQAAAPSLEFLQNYGNFLQFNAVLKAKQATSFYLSYTTELQRQVDVAPSKATRSYSAGKFYFDLAGARMYGYPLLNFNMLVHSEEQMVAELKLDKKFVKGESQAEWKTQALSMEDMGMHEIAVDGGYVLGEDPQKAFFSRAGKKLNVHSNYTITASSSNAGEGSRVENLQNAQGSWQEGAEGNGKGEKLSLQLSAPQRFYGLVLGIGQNPDNNPALDIASRHGLYQTNPRPARFKITLNDDYSFFASVGDFWAPQVVLNPGYARKITKLDIEIVDVYPSKANSDLGISRLQLITAGK